MLVGAFECCPGFRNQDTQAELDPAVADTPVVLFDLSRRGALCCTRCGERERVELDATKALGNDRVP